MNIIFTNWRRRNNLYKIIEETKKQTLVPKIFVVDNASNDPNNCFETTDESITVIKKDNSKMCWERWLVALDNPQKYFCVMDDDINFAKNDILESGVTYLDVNEKVDAIGAYGVKYVSNKNYFSCEHTYCKHKDVPVPILKGRFIMLRFSSVANLDRETELTCDDIKVSSVIRNKILPGAFVNGFVDLPEGNESLSVKSYQNVKRDLACKRYFK